MRKGRPIPALTVMPDERETLGRWARRPKADQALAQRARIILACGSQPILPMRPGQVERRAHDYKRNGTTSLFAALDSETGKVIGQLNRHIARLSFASSWTRSMRRHHQGLTFI